METVGKTWEPIEYEGKQVRLYPDGSIRNAKGHPVAGTKIPNGGSEITSDNAREMQARGVQRKREVMLRASGQVVQNKALIAEYGEYAPVAERAQTLQIIASTPDAGKAAVMAHQALTLDTGMSEKQAQEVGPASSDPLNAALVGLVQAVTARIGADNYPYRKHNTSQAVPDVVEGEATEADEGSGGG